MELKIPGSFILCGSQGTGKSTLIHYMMYKLRKKFKYGLVFTNTFFDNDPFPYIPKKYIHPEYSEEALTKLMDIQADLVAKKKINECFVIFDDCINSNEQFKSDALIRLCTQLRHYHITLIMSTQYCNKLPGIMRTNCMGVFIFKSDARLNLEAIYHEYGQRFDTYNDFKEYVFKKLSEKYRFIYYNKFTEKTKLEDVYQVMICPPKIPKFKIEF